MRKLTSVFRAFFLLIMTCSFHTNVMAKDIQYERNPNLDYIAINNIVIENTKEEEYLKVKSQDPVKIAGVAEPNQSVEISFEDQKYSSVSDENGNWFVIFSVQNLNPGTYPVNICLGDSKDTESLIHLVVQEDTVDVEGTNEEGNGIDENTISNFLPLAILGLFFIILTSYGFYYSLRKTKNDN